MSNTDILGAKIKEIAQLFWESNKLPLLLSNLPRLLLPEIPEYKDLLGKTSLKHFIKETAVTFEYKVIEHPTQRAKIAVVPSDISYEFPIEKPRIISEAANPTSGSRKTVIAFLKEISHLPSEDLEKISIPISVLVKLLK